MLKIRVFSKVYNIYIYSYARVKKRDLQMGFRLKGKNAQETTGKSL